MLHSYKTKLYRRSKFFPLILLKISLFEYRPGLYTCIPLLFMAWLYSDFLKAQALVKMNIPNEDKLIEQEIGEGNPKYSIIWLHGLGASSNDFPPVVPYLNIDNSLSVRFVFPQAPNRSITVNQGMVMPGWYDIKGTSIADKEDKEGFLASANIVNALVQREIERGIASKNIILAGFSQGGAVCYFTATRSQVPLGGIIALSTYLPFVSELPHKASSINKNIPILSMHGTVDNVVPLELGEKTVEVLRSNGYSVDWRTYSMGHSVVPEQIQDIGHWINDLLLRK